MRNVTLSFAASLEYQPPHPERTSRREVRGGPMGSGNVEFKVWSSRGVMARAIRMQERRERTNYDWRAVVALRETEGY